MTSPRQADQLVIGGGPAGAMLALRLAAAGREVTLLEKERAAHHKVCGEFLSSEAVAYLRGAGIDALSLGAAAIRIVRLAAGSRLTEASLPFTALSLSRCLLDQALLVRAAEAGCNVVRGARVESLTVRNHLWEAKVPDGGLWRSPTVFLASGKHDLAGFERTRTRHANLVAFKLHWRLADPQTEALCNAIEIFLFTGGYGGLSLVEDNIANLCLVARRPRLREVSGWAGLLASILEENRHVRDRLHHAKPLWTRPLAIFPIPYGYLAPPAQGIWRLGDQAAVIPSFTGDGVSIALHSGALAARMYLAGASAEEFHFNLHRQLRRSMRISMQISGAMISTAGRAIAPRLLSLAPHAIGWIAGSTRIPGHALAPLAK